MDALRRSAGRCCASTRRAHAAYAYACAGGRTLTAAAGRGHAGLALSEWTRRAPRARRTPSLPAQHQQRRGKASPPGKVGTPIQRYNDLVASGEITRDAKQESVVKLLDDMSGRIANYAPSGRAVTFQQAAAPAAPSGGGGFFGGFFGGSKAAAPQKPAEPPRMLPTGPKGLYVWGGCGSGKTFLMDLFYEAVPVERKKRIHFHEWMIDVHERLHRLQKKNAMVQDKANTVWTAEAALAQQKELKKGAGAGAPKGESADSLVVQVANEMLSEAWLLCFDEFQVTHISDAIIMKRLFSVLFEKGAVVIATSNRPPEDLYLNGLNRPLFLPFIPMLKDFCDVHNIDSSTDYRLITSSEEEDRRVYIYPNGKEEQKLLERKFHRLCKGETTPGAQVETQGRRIVVPKAATQSNIAWFRFKDLCDRPLGAADYLALTAAFHTIFVADIPKLTMQERDQVRRFITMIDAFYERHTKLICTADEDPMKLFQVSEDEKKNSVVDEVFAWDRTVSRLIEMQSVKYLSESVRRIDSDQFLGQFELHALTDDDIIEMWRRYDADDSGEIDPAELTVMLEDFVEALQGHRNVQDEVRALCMETMDLDKNGRISFDEFSRYMKDSTKVSLATQR